MPEPTPSAADRTWIRAAVDQFEGPLTIYAARLLGDDDRARDVVQDVFLRLWTADRDAIADHLAAWLYAVCRNRATDVRRKERRMTRLERPERTTTAEAESPGASAETDEGRAMLELVSGLPPRQQEAVRLRFQGGLSYREIADVMDTNANNVGVLLHAAIRSIRRSLADRAASTAGPATG